MSEAYQVGVKLISRQGDSEGVFREFLSLNINSGLSMVRLDSPVVGEKEDGSLFYVTGRRETAEELERRAKETGLVEKVKILEY